MSCESHFFQIKSLVLSMLLYFCQPSELRTKLFNQFKWFDLVMKSKKNSPPPQCKTTRVYITLYFDLDVQWVCRGGLDLFSHYTFLDCIIMTTSLHNTSSLTPIRLHEYLSDGVNQYWIFSPCRSCRIALLYIVHMHLIG